DASLEEPAAALPDIGQFQSLHFLKPRRPLRPVEPELRSGNSWILPALQSRVGSRPRTRSRRKPMSRISRIEAIPNAAPDQDRNDLDGTVDTVIVRVVDEDGRFGIGEADAPPAAVKSFLEMSTAHLWSRNALEVLAGQDPIEVAALWQRLYEGTFWPGRRGLGIH